MKEFCTRWILWITTLFSIELLNNLSTSLYSDDTVLNVTRVYCLVDGIEAQLLGLSVFDTFVIGFPFLDDLGRKKLKILILKQDRHKKKKHSSAINVPTKILKLSVT